VPDTIVPIRTYVVVCIVLLVLTGINIATAHLPLGPWNTPLSLGIAVVEVVLMALYLMQFRFSPPVTRLVAVAAVLWLGILVVGVMDDILTRGWLPAPGK
jgi:caa(3)-type oxidase subunit IV